MSKNDKTTQNYDINQLMLPLSILLGSLLITVSIVYSASVILNRDQLVKKSELRTIIRDELAQLKLNDNSSTNNQENSNRNSPSSLIKLTDEQLNEIISTRKILVGNKDAKLKFIEFGDPSCPYCSLAAANPLILGVPEFAGYEPPLPEIKKMVDEGVALYAWVYLPTHGTGKVAAQIFYCSSELNKFWEVHDTLMKGEGYQKSTYEVGNDVSKADKLLELLKGTVNTNHIQECLSSRRYEEQLEKDINLARSLGINATPIFFVNNDQVQGSDFKSFKNLIEKYK